MCGRHKGRSKFHAESTEANGKRYPSKLEADDGAGLRYEQIAGEIRDLREQVHVELAGCVGYCADFAYVELPRERFVHRESKGKDGERWRVVKNLWRMWGDTPLHISKRVDGRVVVVETILPNFQRRRAFLLAELAKLDAMTQRNSVPLQEATA